MKSDKTSRPQLTLEEIPFSDRTLTIGRDFMASDNLESIDAKDLYDDMLMSRIILRAPFKVSFSIILICTSGSLRLRCQMKEFEITSGSMLIVPQETICEMIEMQNETRLIMLAYSDNFEMLTSESALRAASGIYTEFMKIPHIRLSTDEVRHIINAYELLRFRISDPTFIAPKELAGETLKLIFAFVSSHLLAPEQLLRKPMNRTDRIFDDFLRLVDIHGARHRELDFYADKLYISAKHLSKVVAQASGRSPRSWICMRTILEAKVLLKEGNLTIQQISERLNFPNQSFFGSFFKRFVGVAPSNYRN